MWPPASGLVLQREEGYPPGHTCWWLRWVHGQERKRCGAGSHSVVFRAQCLGHRSEGREGSHGQCNSQLCWPQTLLVLGQPQGSEEHHVGYTVPWQLVERSWLTGTRAAARPKRLTGPGTLLPLLLLLLPSTQGAASQPCQPLPVTLDFSASDVSP